MRARVLLPLAAVGSWLLQLPLYRGYLTDDSYIYARFARNLAERGELAFNAGEPVHAATSPLWAALGALGALAGLDPFVALKGLGMLVGALSVALFARLALHWLPTPGWAALATVVFATEPLHLRWSASGMETPLAVLALLALVALGAGRGTPRAPLAMGVVGGLAVLVRPEFLLLDGLLALAMAWSAPAALPRFLLGLALPLGAWAAWAMPVYGHLLPETVQAKSTPLGLQLQRLLHNLRVLAQLFALAAALPTLAFLAGWRPRRLRPDRDRPWVEPVLWVWCVALPAVYLLRDVQVVSRYLELVLPVVVLLGSSVAAHARWSRALRTAWLGQAALGLLLSALWIGPSVRAFSATIDTALGDIAGYLQRHGEPGDVVAIYDIGLVGYRSGMQVLDLGGLVHPGINDLRDEVGDREILERGLFLDFAPGPGQPRWLVDRDPAREALAGRTVGDRRPVPVMWRQVANLGLSRGDPVWYTLYRLEPAAP